MPGFDASYGEIVRARESCTRRLSGSRWLTPREELARLAASRWAEGTADSYGKGGALAALEERTASLLGKEAGLFFHKGVAAQLAAIKAYAPEAGARIAIHPLSHIEADENHAAELVLGVCPLLLGQPDAPFSVADLNEATARGEKPALVIVELPLRNAGYLMPEWDELVALSSWCRAQNIPLHFDGARLWEAHPFYARPLAEVCALADSVYVSFYKGLGGLAGSMLAGNADFLARVLPWKERLAGNIVTQFPYVVSAHEGLDAELPRMQEYFEKARALALAVQALPGVEIIPPIPQCNSFQVHLPAPADRVKAALLAFAKRSEFWLAGHIQASPSGASILEAYIGSASDAWNISEAVTALAEVLAEARVPG